jgi:hypothetical protein
LVEVALPQRGSGTCAKTFAGTVVADAQQHKELLIKHGLVEQVLQSLSESLD